MQKADKQNHSFSFCNRATKDIARARASADVNYDSFTGQGIHITSSKLGMCVGMGCGNDDDLHHQP